MDTAFRGKRVEVLLLVLLVFDPAADASFRERKFLSDMLEREGCGLVFTNFSDLIRNSGVRLAGCDMP